MPFIYFIFSFFFLLSCSQHQGPQSKFAVRQSKSLRQTYEATASHFVIATLGLESTRAAKEIYAEGGNLVDAAIASSFVISVERPQSTGLGGGGFLLYRDGKSKKVYAIDFRERAPLAAKEKMFLDKQGNIIPKLSTTGILASGTPGIVAGLWEIHQKFGRLPWQRLLQHAIDLAEKGLVVYDDLAKAMKSEAEVLAQFPESKKIFLKSNGEAYRVGDKLAQKDLARTLKLIADQGPSVFYRGEIANKIIAENKAHGGLMRSKDLANYKVYWRKAARGKFKEYEVVSFPPPSSGGAHVIEILNILENDPLQQYGFWSTNSVHLTSAAMQLAFADRAKFLGDPDFVKVPLRGLTSKSYAAKQRKLIDLARARNIGWQSAALRKH